MTSAFYGYAYAGEIRVGWGLATEFFNANASAWVNYFISGGAKKMAENANSPPLL